jgi:predicted transcriptional regulator
MNIKESIDAVDLVDKLMTQFRYGVEPEDKDIIKAYELGISVQALKAYIEEFELEGYFGEEDDEDDADNY